MSKENRETAISRAVDLLKGKSKFAQSLNKISLIKVTPQGVDYWLEKGAVVPKFAPYIERVTAEQGERIRMEDLCPDMPWDLVAELLADKTRLDV